MKHILRLIVVAALCLGIFFGITTIVNNKKPYSIREDYDVVYKSFKELDKDISKLNGMTETGMDKFFLQNKFYSFAKNSIQDFCDVVESLNLNKNESGKFKTLKKQIQSNCEELNSKVNEIYEYNFNTSNPDSGTLTGTIDKANEIFETCNKALINACLEFNNFINNKVYENVNYNFKDTLNYNIFVMIEAYYDAERGENEILTALTKYSDFIASGKVSSFDASNFVQTFYTFDYSKLLTNYSNYFSQSAQTDEGFSDLIDFVLEGEYYEKD